MNNEVIQALQDPYSWQIADISATSESRVNGFVWSVSHMNDGELQQAIVDDVLAIHMMRKEFGEISFTRQDLVRHVMPENSTRVLQALDSAKVADFVVEICGQLSIRKGCEQTAQDFAGVVYSGDPEQDGLYYTINAQVYNDLVLHHGTEETLAKSLIAEGEIAFLNSASLMNAPNTIQ